LQRYSNLTVFKIAAVRHLGFVRLNVLTVGKVRGPLCISVPNFVKIGQTVAGFCDFQDGDRRHLGFSKIRNFNGRFAVRGEFASPRQFHQIGQTVADIQQFNRFKNRLPAVRHLGFVGRILGPHTMSTWWSVSLCQIWLKSMQ